MGAGGSWQRESSTVQYNNDLTFNTDVGVPGHAFLGYDFRLAVPQGDFGPTISLNFGTSSSALQTFTGLGNFQSYAGLSANDQAVFESTIGSSYPLVTGSGFGSIQAVAVPEPSSTVATGVVIGAVGLLVRRRLRKQFGHAGVPGTA